MDATVCPNHPEEPMPCKSKVTRDTLRAEAGPVESMIILEGDFNFRQLIISLLENKCVTWTTNVIQLFHNETTTAKNLESNFGRLGHFAIIVPGVHNFLSHLHDLQQIATHHRSIKISKTCRNDPILMLWFLDIAKRGINMNLIAFRRLTHVYRPDSCPFGLKGYPDKGFAWRFKLLQELFSEHQTTCLNTSRPSSHLGLTFWLAA
jgi:hypothetical protein